MPSCVTNPEHVLRILRRSLVNLLIQSKATKTTKATENPQTNCILGHRRHEDAAHSFDMWVFKRNVFGLKLYIC